MAGLKNVDLVINLIQIINKIRNSYVHKYEMASIDPGIFTELDSLLSSLIDEKFDYENNLQLYERAVTYCVGYLDGFTILFGKKGWGTKLANALEKAVEHSNN